jgi:hypothetical protein
MTELLMQAGVKLTVESLGSSMATRGKCHCDDAVTELLIIAGYDIELS